MYYSSVYIFFIDAPFHNNAWKVGISVDGVGLPTLRSFICNAASIIYESRVGIDTEVRSYIINDPWYNSARNYAPFLVCQS